MGYHLIWGDLRDNNNSTQKIEVYKSVTKSKFNKSLWFEGRTNYFFIKNQSNKPGGD